MEMGLERGRPTDNRDELSIEMQAQHPLPLLTNPFSFAACSGGLLVASGQQPLSQGLKQQSRT